MAPVTATSAGVPRQTIDDPQLVALLERLSEFAPKTSPKTSSAASDCAISGAAIADGGAGGGDGDVEMAGAADGTTDAAANADGKAGDAGSLPTPPLDIDGLVKELEKVPKWRFQEQADLYEWIRPLNAMDAALEYFLEAYPGLLLLPRETSKTDNPEDKGDEGGGENEGRDADGRGESPGADAEAVAEVPPSAVESISTILSFLSTLLRSATNKFLFNSVPTLSSLLSSASDTVSSLAVETLAALAAPPMLHRQQAPEMSSHTTQLHKGGGGGGGEVMWRLTCEARGWGTKGSGLGLLSCVTLDDSTLAADEEHFPNINADNQSGKDGGGGKSDNEKVEGVDAERTRDRGESQERSFRRSAGEISFECYVRPPEGELSETGELNNGTLVSIYVPWEDMFAQPKKGAGENGEDSTEGQAEKRRRIGSPTPKPSKSPARTLKSTSQLYQECLASISAQLDGKDPTKLLPRSELFSLLSSIRLARSFHSSSSRVAAIERRLRALAAVVHAHPGLDSVGAYFSAQPELVGELVDLLRPTVSAGNISSGVAVDDDGEEKKADISVGDAGDVGDGAGGDAATDTGIGGGHGASSILPLSDSPLVPYAVRTLSIEALTALVARRDAASGTLTNVARQANVLGELGVGKGQYLGLLPTLIRYSLAALNGFLMHAERAARPAPTSTAGADVGKKGEKPEGDSEGVRDIGLQLGLAFLRATKPPPLPAEEREERALEFVDSVLTLTSAVISVSTGTASLTDCGIIPALVSTVALDTQIARRQLLHSSSNSGGGGGSPFRSSGEGEGESYPDTLLKFVTAQAIQILEGAIVTHNPAMSAFHELKGVDILVSRLDAEVQGVRRRAEGSKSSDNGADDGDGDKEIGSKAAGGGDADLTSLLNLSSSPAIPKKPKRKLRAARRVLLFSSVNCLTVVFHRHDSRSPASDPHAPTGASQLRKPELHSVLVEIMDNVESYGGVLAALVATFLTDVMNADPQVVHHVHSSGLAESFLGLLMGRGDKSKMPKSIPANEPFECALPPSGELIMALPNVLTALSLTEAGSKSIAEINPFPALLAIFVSPKYVMPNSRCLLTEMAAIIGSGLDELMRHNPSLREKCLGAVVGAMKRAAWLGKNLVSDEDGAVVESIVAAEAENAMEEEAEVGADAVATNAMAMDTSSRNEGDEKPSLEERRTHLLQYSHNLAQLLEHLFHSEDHVSPFVAAGGFDALLDLAKWTAVPGGRGVVANLSCLSAPGAITSGPLMGLVNTVCGGATDPSKLIKKIVGQLETQLFCHGSCVKSLTLDDSRSDALSSEGVLEPIPPKALHDLGKSPGELQLLRSLGCLFRSSIHVDWLVNALAGAIRGAVKRGSEFGSGIGREREWKKELASDSFKKLVRRLSLLHRTSLYEVCRVRTEPGFDERDEVRSNKSERQLVYRIRIVCQEGAVVRDGIDIDRCENVGSLEQGEVVEAYDRCINSSGVLRYRTPRGWVSELTRGQGRESITEVLDVRVAGPPTPAESKSGAPHGRIECGVPDLRSAAAGVLARLHGAHAGLFSALEKAMASGLRPQQRALSFRQEAAGAHSVAAASVLSQNLKAALDYAKDEVDSEGGDEVGEEAEAGASDVSAKNAATCMYLGNQLGVLHSSLCEEKREEHRRAFNVPLLLNLLASDGWRAGLPTNNGEEPPEPPADGGSVMKAIKFVLEHSLADMAKFAAEDEVERNEEGGEEEEKKDSEEGLKKGKQRMSRAVAASLPPTLGLLRRLTSRALICDPTATAAIEKMKRSEFNSLIGLPNDGVDKEEPAKFNAGQFARALHLRLAKLTFGVWSDGRFASAPSHVIHPFVQYLCEVLRSLEEGSKAVDPSPPPPSASSERLVSSLAGSRLRDLQDPGSRQHRILASMGLLRDPGAAAGAAQEEEEAEEEPFEPSEESISRLSEMGFSRDHATEALEAAGTNRVDVAMEYALTHPPSSPGTLERRRAAREQRRQEQRERAEERRRRREEAERQSSSQGEDSAAAGEASTSEGQDQPADSDAPGNADGKADGKADEEPKPKEPTEEEKRAKREKELEERLAGEAKEYLEGTVKPSLVKVGLYIVEGCAAGGEIEPDEVTEKDNGGDSQGVIVVISNFLLDACRAYPALEADLASELLRRLKAKLDVKSPSHCRVKAGCERAFAALLHASVVIFRALPKLRPSILRNGNVIVAITHCVRSCTLASALRGGKDTAGKDKEHSPMVWPRWLAPALLILEVMAQPVPFALEEEGSDESGQSKPVNKKSEYAKLLSEHKKIHKKQASVMTNVFNAVTNKDAGGKSAPKKKKDPDSKKQSDKKAASEDDAPADGEEAVKGGKEKAKAQPTPPLPVPPFLPLLHSEMQEACMVLCLQLLGLKSKKGVVDKAHLERVCPPPTIANAIFVLLVKLLRSRDLASKCLQMGGADLLVALPGRSFFAGNRELLSVLLRRMLEDEATLHSMMVGEIRGVVTKIYRKQHPSAAAQQTMKVNLKSFMTACTPLICRDPMVFIKASLTCVKIGPPGSESSSLSSSRGSQVTLLSCEERARNAKVMSSFLARNSADFPPSEKALSQEEPSRRASRGRSKSPHRASLAKSQKSTPATKISQKNHIHNPNEHISSLLLREIMRDSPSVSSSSDDKQPFLSTLDCLALISDLVLAVPACGAAIHRYKPAKDVVIHNAISGCPDPPQTAVSYVLHKLLPQPRLDGSLSTDAGKKIQLHAYEKTKMAQAAARLIVCLVARSGEGRRRVISELVFALNCRKRTPNSVVPSRKEGDFDVSAEAEMWAITAWAEMISGLSAPRSNPGSVASQDSNASLSFGVVKLMLEAGAPHALMAAIERIQLHHPMASSVASSIIRPLEIFTRVGVYNTVSEMAEKESAKLEASSKGTKESRRTTFGPSQRSESEMYDGAIDGALEDEFAASNPARRNAESAGDSLDESMEHSDHEDDDDESMEDDSDESSEIEVRLGNVDDSDASDASGDPDEDISSSESSSDGEDESDSDEDMDEDDAGDDEELFSSEEDEEADGWGVDGNEDDFFDGNAEDEVNNGAPAGGNEADDGTGMEGWTRVDANAAGGPRGLGSMLLDMVQPGGGGGGRAQNGGFLMDAAETMLGSILRGDIEGLSEIEDTLGIRISRGDPAQGMAGLPVGTNRAANPNAPRRGGVTVQQSASAFGGNRSILESSSPMEFVFGGPHAPQAQDLPPTESQGRLSEDTNLFPGGLQHATHPSSRPITHPMLQSVRLPPITSLVSAASDQEGNNLQELNTRTIAASGYITGPNGAIIRVNDRFHSSDPSRRGAPSTLSGWVDDGLPPDRTAEEFSVSFGQSLNQFLQDQEQLAQAQNVANPPDEEDAPPEGPGGPEGESQEESSRQNDDEADAEDHAEAEEPEAPTENDDMDDAETGNNDPPPPAPDAEPSADDAPAPHDPPTENDEGGERNDSEESAEGVHDVPMGDGSGDAEENAEQQEANHDEPVAQPDVEQEEANETNQDEVAPGADAEAETEEAANNDTSAAESGQLTCPPDIDPEAFNALPEEMQQELVQQHQMAEQISGTGLDPEALAALPEEMRREVIEQEQQQQRLREQQASQPAADPANAEDMDNASFLASLAPDLRQEILITADEAFLASLPPTIQTEAHVLRERLASQHRRRAEETNATNPAGSGAGGGRAGGAGARAAQPAEGQSSRGRRQRNGKLRVESDRNDLVWSVPGRTEDLGPLLTTKSAQALISALFYTLSPIQSQRIVHKLLLNMCLCEQSRALFLNAFVGLLNNDRQYVHRLMKKLELDQNERGAFEPSGSMWPPSALIGTTSADLIEDRNSSTRIDMFRRRQGGNSAVTVAASLPSSARGGGSSIPPVVSRKIRIALISLCKSSPRVAFSMLGNAEDGADAPRSDDCSCLEKLLGLLEMNEYSQSASNLEQLLSLLEIVVAPMSLLPKIEEQEIDLSSERASPGKEWVKVPRQVVSKRRLHLLINTLSSSQVKDSAFLKINTLTRRLSRVEANRECILDELALVAEELGRAAIIDLKAVSVRLSSAAKHHREKIRGYDGEPMLVSGSSLDNDLVAGTPSSAVSLSTSNSELKLLRVLQMLNSLCAQEDESKSEGSPPEFVTLLQSLKLESLWDQLSYCLKTVGVLEGVTLDADESDDGEEEENDNDKNEDDKNGKKLQNSVAGLITRFLPAIEAFFMVNALPLTEENESGAADETASLVDNSRVVQFAAQNKILLNALLRSNPNLLEKGLRAMVKMPKCRLFLDFDVKRHWFKTQVRRLRQQASRRHGSFRLTLRRKYVFEDSFHAFVHRNADELRGRLHITFQNEEGVDAGGLSREFFAILAKEMFNPNYALFMSTEDGCTFQPNPNSSINPDDLRYFRFVGRIVGKAVVDGFLLDAHFTRSLYKHMLGVKPTHHDMQAIDPDYYKNLQMILEHNLEDIGLELTFSTEDHSFGRSRTIDLIPDGRKIPVTEESKARYVDLVCQHRMTTAIENQIKAYLEGFHEMVDRDLISIFTPKELELLISGMPDIDIHDLKKNTDYNGYRPADREIGWFWNIMFALSRSEKASFLQFVTGSSKVPLAGFGELQGMRGVQKFSINKASGPAGALMSAHTCFNALDLPVYNSEEEMKEKLMYAISEGGGGFGFA